MMFEVIGNVFIAFGVGLVFVGMFGFFRFQDFYSKLLAASKIDATAMVTILIGVAIRSGFNWFTAKVLLILAIILVLTPIATSKIALSARNDEMRGKSEE